MFADAFYNHRFNMNLKKRGLQMIKQRTCDLLLIFRMMGRRSSSTFVSSQPSSELNKLESVRNSHVERGGHGLCVPSKSVQVGHTPFERLRRLVHCRMIVRIPLRIDQSATAAGGDDMSTAQTTYDRRIGPLSGKIQVLVFLLLQVGR